MPISDRIPLGGETPTQTHSNGQTGNRGFHKPVHDFLERRYGVSGSVELRAGAPPVLFEPFAQDMPIPFLTRVGSK